MDARTTHWSLPIPTVILAALAALLVTMGTLPAASARRASYSRHEQLESRRLALQQEIAGLEAEAEALRSDYQYNRRLERLMFRSGPERGD